ncbi:MAG: 50S ribosomal protein L4 [Flavobacteriia bacterium]|nr:50S ribosomal protein L4 [Flavobacteriia bacterium]
MERTVINTQGKDSGRKAKLNDSVFAIEPNEHAIYLDVKQYLANQRQGTHKVKARAEVARTTKKHHKQKGTGGARYGSLKGPLHRGGGTAFGPEPRDYGFKLNKKVKALARRSALSMKAKNDEIIVLEDLSFDAPKTKQYAEILKSLNLNEKKSVVVVGDANKNVYLSSRNFKGSKVVTASELSTYAIMNAGTLVLTEGSIERIENVLSEK